uniref:Lipid-A-disaccharide synthase n=1 Tax=candidate division WOR-3 bacterium TaxID=2052148 RepID=A0A7C4YSE9_UNCW3
MLIKALKGKGIKFFGIGGERMKNEGCEIIFPMEKLEVIGFLEPLFKMKEVYYAKNLIVKNIKKRKPKFAILVDFPGFNLSIARILKSYNVKVFYFIAPQIWAWGRRRSKILRKYVDHLYSILPFENLILEEENVRFSFVGNPLLDIVNIKGEIKRDDFKDYEKIIALLPGSREKEVKKLLPVMLNGFEKFRDKRKFIGIIALSNEKFLDFVEEEIKNYEDIKVFINKTYDVLNVSDAAIISSGTATLESAMIGTPMVVVYKISFLSYLIAKILVKIKYVSLVNLIMGEEIVPELIQKFSTDDIVEKLNYVIGKNEYYKNKFKILNKKLGSKGVYERVAIDILHRI